MTDLLNVQHDSFSEKIEKKAVKRSLLLLQFFKGIITFELVFAVLIPFFQQNGLSHTEIFVVLSGLSCAALITEIPGGRFADRYGRKPSLMVGAAMLLGAYILLALAHGFWTIFLAEVMIGAGTSFIQGADEALAYDLLKSIGEEHKFKRFGAICGAYTAAGSCAAALVGPWLASQYDDIRLIVSLQAPIYILLLCVGMLLREVRCITQTAKRPKVKTWPLIKHALHGHKEFKWLVVYTAILTTATNVAFWLRPTYYQLAGMPLNWFGNVQAIGMLIAVLTSLILAKWSIWFDRKRAPLVFIMLIGMLYSFLAIMPPAIGMLPVFLSISIVGEIGRPILSNRLNVLVNSEVRASSLSIAGAASRLSFCVISPAIGWMADTSSLATAFWVSAGIFSALGVMALIAMSNAVVMHGENEQSKV